VSDDIDRTDELLELIDEDQRRESALRNGHHPDDPGPAEPGDDTREDRQTADNDDDDDQHPQHFDVGAFFAGTAPQPPKPVLMHRTDGRALFYAGKLNLVFGDPESGKTLLVLAACAEALHDGRRALYVDLDHNGPEFILPLLVAFGVGVDTLSDPALFRYYDDIDAALSMLMLVEESAVWRPAVAVIDSIGELLPMMGASSNDGDDFTRAHTNVLKPLAKSGAAVIEIDHLPKNLFTRSQGPVGTAAKRRPVGGLAVKVICRRTFIPGKGGTAELQINKDRTGGVRRHSPPGRPQSAGTFVLDTPDDNGVIGWRVIPPLELAAMPSAAPRYLEAIRQMSADTFTVRDVAVAMSGEEAVTKSQTDQARYHIEALVDAAMLTVAVASRKGVTARFQLADNFENYQEGCDDEKSHSATFFTPPTSSEQE
jgi:hypothetical protein